MGKLDEKTQVCFFLFPLRVDVATSIDPDESILWIASSPKLPKDSTRERCARSQSSLCPGLGRAYFLAVLVTKSHVPEIRIPDSTRCETLPSRDWNDAYSCNCHRASSVLRARSR